MEICHMCDCFFSLHQTKILRVLNLWEKNGVFEMDIIQPLMDMCNETIVPAPTLQGREKHMIIFLAIWNVYKKCTEEK